MQGNLESPLQGQRVGGGEKVLVEAGERGSPGGRSMGIHQRATPQQEAPVALPVVPQLLWALVPWAQDARPAPPRSGMQVQETPSQTPGRTPGESDRQRFRLLCSTALRPHERVSDSLQNLPSVIFIYPKVEKTPRLPLVQPHA